MSADTYRDAARRLRDALDQLGPYRGACGLCGWPDARHRLADSISGAILAGDSPEDVAGDYLPGGVTPAAVRVALEVTVAVLAAHPYRHRLTRDAAAGLDREVWADLTEPAGK
jgi:hypothetical protein